MSRAPFVLAFVLALGLGAACDESPEPGIPDGPTPWSARASVDTSTVQVGEDLTFTLTLTHPPGGEFQPPPTVAFEPFAVIDLTTEEPSPIETRLHFRLAAYRLPEDLEIPRVEVRYRDETGEVQLLETEPIPVKLVTSLTPDVTDIHDIKGPMGLTVARDYSLLWWLLLALLAALIAYLLYRKFRKAPEIDTRIVAPPLPPPELEAEAALKRLAEKDLVGAGLIPAFYAELAEIMKRYAGRRFEVPYLERTTIEILSDLGNGNGYDGLRAILEASDLVKFAKLMPAPDHAHGSFRRAEQFLAETRPVRNAEVTE